MSTECKQWKIENRYFHGHSTIIFWQGSACQVSRFLPQNIYPVFPLFQGLSFTHAPHDFGDDSFHGQFYLTSKE